MNSSIKIAAAAIALTMFVGSGSAAFAKAHDQGVADGDHFAGSTQIGGNGVGGPGGVSAGQRDGVRGGIASGNGGDNRVEPVERPGLNEPD